MGFSFADSYVQVLVGGLAPKVLGALSVAATEVAAGRADAAMTRWFGDSSVGFRKTLARDLNQLRANLNMRTITIGFEMLSARNNGTNAGAWNDNNRHLNLGANLSHIPSGRAGIELDQAFPKLPAYLPINNNLIDNGGYIQSRFETIVHELSHLLLGTNDEDWNGHTAYGTKRASRLAANLSDKAKTNAENWGIFVEAVGIHKIS